MLHDLGMESSEERISGIFGNFSKHLHENISKVKEITGTSEVFQQLRDHSIAVAVGR